MDIEARNLDNIGVVLLAAGSASRMGQLKQLLEWKGKPLVVHTVERLLAAGIKDIVVVLGSFAEEVRQALRTFPTLTYADNPDFQKGQGESLKIGIQALERLWQRKGPQEIRAVMVALADQPMIPPDVYRKLAEKFLHNSIKVESCSIEITPENPIVLPTYLGQRGNPVIFDPAYLQPLQNISGDQGGRDIVKAYPDQVVEVPVNESAILKDIDTVADYEALKLL